MIPLNFPYEYKHFCEHSRTYFRVLGNSWSQARQILFINTPFTGQRIQLIMPLVPFRFFTPRIIYWILLHTCSSWRAFGSGLTIFPLLAILAFNIYCLFDLGSRDLFFGTQDTYANDTSPSVWPHNVSMSLGDT